MGIFMGVLIIRDVGTLSDNIDTLQTNFIKD